MRQILHILLCTVLAAGITACGNRTNNQVPEDGLSREQKKELKQIAKKVKIRLEEKGNKIIKSIDSPWGTNSTTYTFDGDKCIGYKEIIVLKDAGAAKEAYDGLKEVNDFNHGMKTLEVDGKTLTWEYAQENLDLMFSNMTRAEILKQVKEEIEQAKKFLK